MLEGISNIDNLIVCSVDDMNPVHFISMCYGAILGHKDLFSV